MASHRGAQQDGARITFSQQGDRRGPLRVRSARSGVDVGGGGQDGCCLPKEARAQHAMVLTYLLDLKAAVLTASCTRFRRKADSPHHMVTVEKGWTGRAQWTEASSAGVPWK